MINFLQSNHTPDSQLIKANIISNALWEELIEKIQTEESANKIGNIYRFIEKKSSNYNIEIKVFYKGFYLLPIMQ